MFFYFGYGSNINLISLKAKGVSPLSSERGVLYGWRLRFNVAHWFRHEGGVGNIEPSTNPDDFVEGMVHFCYNEHLASLDAVESYGLGYDRTLVNVTVKNKSVMAQTYIGLPGFINNSCLPSQRYLNIILKGAVEAGLTPYYIDKLRKQPVQPESDFPVFVPPVGNWQQFNKHTLALHPTYTAMGGSVFDMQHAKEQLLGIIPLLAGKDMTLFFVKRHDSSTGNETDEDISSGNISEAAKKYINAYLNAFAEEYVYVGSYNSQTD